MSLAYKQIVKKVNERGFLRKARKMENRLVHVGSGTPLHIQPDIVRLLILNQF